MPGGSTTWVTVFPLEFVPVMIVLPELPVVMVYEGNPDIVRDSMWSVADPEPEPPYASEPVTVKGKFPVEPPGGPAVKTLSVEVAPAKLGVRLFGANP